MALAARPVSHFAVTSERSPLVLLHSATASGRIWQDIAPLVSEYHDVHAPTLLGHRGGPDIQRRPAGVSDLVDAAEHYLDEHGLARPHLADPNWTLRAAAQLGYKDQSWPVQYLSGKQQLERTLERQKQMEMLGTSSI